MSKKYANRYNVLDLAIQFDDYLESKKLSKISRKNYVSDIRSYALWLNKEDFDEVFSLNSLVLYKEYLMISSLPISSINRSLSSLRAFGDLLVQLQLEYSNAARMIANVPVQSIKPTTYLVTEFSKEHDLSSTDIQLLEEFLSLNV